MKKLADKFLRDNLDTSLLNNFKRLYPHFEFEHRFRRVPTYPKIILYSNVASVDKFLQQIFPAFKIITPKPSNQSDEVLAKQIATQIVRPSDTSKFDAGVIVHGFPFNSAQALLLDRYLNGVNLALHVRGGQASQDFSSLLNYYSERGTLVEIDFNEKLNAEQFEALQKKLIMSMKRSQLN